QARQQAVVAAALEASPGLLRPVHAAPSELWHLPGTWVAGTGERDVLVATPDGLLQGVEPETGRVRWGVDGPPPGGSSWCTVLHRTPDGTGITRTATGTRPAALALCEEGTWAAGLDGSRIRLTLARTLDPATGAVLAERALGGGLLVSDVVDGDLLHASADQAGFVSVARWDPWTGEPRWAFRSDRRITDRRSNGVQVHHGAGTLSFVGSSTLTLDLGSGRQVDRPGDTPPADAVVGYLADGAAVLAGARDGGTTTRVLAPDGTLRYTTEGAPLLPSLRVGSAAGVLLVRATDGGVRAVEAATGAPLWRERPSGRGPDRAADLSVLAEVDATVVLTDAVEAWGVDLRTGRPAWRHALADVARLQPLTDGAVVVLPVQDGTPSGSLLAVEVRSGAELWRTPLAPGTKGVRPAHGLLLVESEDGITALG
ncbi:hypothetical protein N866_20300, partial [Actinotalea ferrariae CF5-4]